MDNYIQTLTILGGMIGGAFALIKYVMTQLGKMHTEFLSHLEKKNGHLERTAERFDATVNSFNDTIRQHSVDMQKSVDKLAEKIDGIK